MMADKNTNPPIKPSTTPEPIGKQIKMSSGTAQQVESPTKAPKPQTAAVEQSQSSGNAEESTNVSTGLLNEAGEVEAVSA